VLLSQFPPPPLLFLHLFYSFPIWLLRREHGFSIPALFSFPFPPRLTPCPSFLHFFRIPQKPLRDYRSHHPLSPPSDIPSATMSGNLLPSLFFLVIFGCKRMRGRKLHSLLLFALHLIFFLCKFRHSSSFFFFFPQSDHLPHFFSVRPVSFFEFFFVCLPVGFVFARFFGFLCITETVFSTDSPDFHYLPSHV